MTGGTVELRVHGVSGSPPESVLGVPAVVQVAGDSLGRFFRPADAVDGGLEGYHWGLFTSGSWRQGLWFLLLPFGLVNLAAQALPAGRSGPARTLALAALRLLGAVLTATFALGLTTVLVDLAAVQRGGGPWAVLTGLVAVLTGLTVVALLGRGRVPAAPPGERAPPPVDPPRTVLADPAFYTGDPDVPVLRRLHAATGLLVPAAPAAVAIGLGWVPLAGAAGLAGLLLALGDPRAPARWWRRGRAPEQGRRAAGALAWVVLGGAAALLAGSWTALLVRGVPGALPALTGVLELLVWTGTATLGVLLVAVAVGRSGTGVVPRAFRPLAGGLVAWVVASVGAALGLGFTAGLVWATRRVLGGDVSGVYRAVAAGWGVATALLAAAFVVALLGGVRLLPRLRARAAAGYPAGTDAGVVRSAAAGLWTAGLRRRVPGLLVGAAVLGQLAALVLLAGSLGLRLPVPEALGAALVAVGTVALVGFAVGLLLAGRGAVLHPGVRRGVNVLWDVVAFWPREVHPVVPPPYSQRAVTDVAGRVVWLLTHGGAARVTLVGYSQGSLICLAAVLHLPPELRPRVALLTHASQLQLAYARTFPRAVPVELLRWALRELPGRWRSLFRDTDPFGGAVLSWDRSPDDGPLTSTRLTSTRLTATGEETGPDVVGPRGERRCGPEWRLPDPALVDPQRRPWPGRRGHTDHTEDPVYPSALVSVWGRPPGG
ncbi:hypothetical protein [Modestobacter sp. Leaf380]|uniref:hypothetical protein n=1 Tax=Modestobacter sp. Leaf380 TaxID=1736356 RepID=UPI0006F7E021|nr:hypothetical protein [Modestobacter sp. Leaf380]KQS63606.1 hypothetical protein ASG41_18325 [Modestobacter sp. Leaf380]